MTDPARAQLTAVASGRTVAVSEAGLTFGGADADVPVEGVDDPVAFLDLLDDGFVVTDRSQRCTVNARPVIGQRLAQVGDTIHVAGEAFVLEPYAVAAPRPPMAVESLTPVALAHLEVVGSGILGGRIFPLVTRLTLVGRGAHNDVVLDDDTVSDSHAKIVRRASGWFVLDEGSSNGTYVAGRRIDGERGLAPGSEVRFGGVKVRFEPLDAEAGDLGGKGTRQVVARPRSDGKLHTTEPVVPPAVASPAPVAIVAGAPPREVIVSRPPVNASRTILGWLLVIVVVVGSGAAGYLVAAMLRGGR